MDTVVVDPFFADVPGLFGKALLETLSRARDPSLWPAFERGEIDEQTLFAGFYPCAEAAARAGFPAPETLRDAIVTRYRFVAGMEALLEELRRQHRLWVLSNYPIWFETLCEQLELERFFEGFVISYRSGQRKPDPGAYEALIRASGADPAEVLLIDDRKENCEAARRQGWQALVFRSVEVLRRELAGRG